MKMTRILTTWNLMVMVLWLCKWKEKGREWLKIAMCLYMEPWINVKTHVIRLQILMKNLDQIQWHLLRSKSSSPPCKTTSLWGIFFFSLLFEIFNSLCCFPKVLVNYPLFPWLSFFFLGFTLPTKKLAFGFHNDLFNKSPLSLSFSIMLGN